MKSTSLPSRCNRASIWTARSTGSATRGSTRGAGGASGIGDGMTGACPLFISAAISDGISPLESTERKHRKAYDNRFPNSIICLPGGIGRNSTKFLCVDQTIMLRRNRDIDNQEDCKELLHTGEDANNDTICRGEKL